MMTPYAIGTSALVVISQTGPQGGSGIAGITPLTSGPATANAATGMSVFTVYNSSAATFDFYLPASPAKSQIVQVIDAGQNAGSYQIVIHGNGNSIAAYAQTASSAGINSNGGSLSLVWDGVQWTQNG